MEHSHPRHIIRNFLPLDLCKELEFIHRSNCTVGYRPHVFSTTLSHLIATNCAHLIMPFIPLRENLKEKVEEVFGCEYELFVEFTGLISFEEDFRGGIFHFHDGEPANFVPMSGDLVLYTADSRNIHCVDEITDGERLTLTLWFSRNSSHDEDAKLLSLLSQNIPDGGPIPCIPLPASSNMYWFSTEQASDHQRGFDICFARLFYLGYDIYPLQGKSCFPENWSGDVSDVFTKPLKLARGDKLFTKEFANLLHALQAVQFYNWKQAVLQQSEATSDTGDVIVLSQAQKEEISKLRQALLSHMKLDEKMFSYGRGREVHFDWACFSAAVTLWEGHILELHKQLLMHLPFWKDHAFLFSVSCPVIEE